MFEVNFKLHPFFFCMAQIFIYDMIFFTENKRIWILLYVFAYCFKIWKSKSSTTLIFTLLKIHMEFFYFFKKIYVFCIKFDDSRFFFLIVGDQQIRRRRSPISQKIAKIRKSLIFWSFIFLNYNAIFEKVLSLKNYKFKN